MSSRFVSSLSANELATLAVRQLNTLFPDTQLVRTVDLVMAIPCALGRLEHCFNHIQNRYFFNGTSAVFDHLNGDHYAMWLYLLASELFQKGGPTKLCNKLFLLNKALHGCDIYYEVELPSVFLLVHPLGTVLGRAKYEDYLMVYQHVCVGSNHDVYPTLGPNLTLHPGSSVLGRSSVGENCSIASNSLLLDSELSSNYIYIGNPRDYVVKPQRMRKPSIWRTK